MRKQNFDSNSPTPPVLLRGPKKRVRIIKKVRIESGIWKFISLEKMGKHGCSPVRTGGLSFSGIEEVVRGFRQQIESVERHGYLGAIARNALLPVGEAVHSNRPGGDQNTVREFLSDEVDRGRARAVDLAHRVALSLAGTGQSLDRSDSASRARRGVD